MSLKMASGSSSLSCPAQPPPPSSVAAVSASSASSSPSPHLCLRWNNYQSNLTSVFDQLLQNETFVDVTLAADGHAIKAHRMVLSACSPYFQHLFFDNPCQHPIVILKDTRWPELKAIVEYMYRGEISVAQEELTSLLKVAETLKIRGLSELNSDRNAAAAAGQGTSGAAVDEDEEERSEASPVPQEDLPTNLAMSSASSSAAAAVAQSASSRRIAAQSDSPCLWSANDNDDAGTRSPTPAHSPVPMGRASAAKRRRVSGSESPSVPPSPAAASTPGVAHASHEDASMDHHDAPLSLVGHHQQSSSSSSSHHHHHHLHQQQHHHLQQHQAPASLLPPPPPQSHSPIMMPSTPASLGQHPLHADDLDIKPGIAELIREEERARMLEGTHPWLTGSPSVLSDTYQYQLQALWQKAWATGQGVMQNLRFRERGPFKTWRPETMAEAIMAVLREGLSLSQAARKFDIPYPTFVLYANRVNNMLGPSADGGSELRPKGRGRPQRILTGSWPEDHVHGVIRAVVFRDPSSLPRHIDREDASKLTANRSTPAPGVSRLLTPPSQQSAVQQAEIGTSGANIRGLIQSAMNNGNGAHNGHEFAQRAAPNVPSTLSHAGPMIPGAPAYSSIRQMAGPSSALSNAANGIMELLAANAASCANGSASGAGTSNNNNNNVPMSGGGHLAAPGASCLSASALSTSSLFNALQQEVSDETRMAALNAMTQRIMNSLDGDNFNIAASMSINPPLNGQGPRGAAANTAAAAAALEAAAWFGPTGSFNGQLPIVDLAAEDVVASPVDDDEDDEDDGVQQMAQFGAHANPAANNPVAVKQEQLFTE